VLPIFFFRRFEMGLPNTPVIQSSALNITVFRCISFFQSWMSIRYALREFVIIELVGIDTKSKPSAASRTAIARPMPGPAAVIRATPFELELLAMLVICASQTRE
jgi:hypothetical protein